MTGGFVIKNYKHYIKWIEIIADGRINTGKRILQYSWFMEIIKF
jgi:desulfoferrodoxin (superoxide reductase-like protein)